MRKNTIGHPRQKPRTLAIFLLVGDVQVLSGSREMKA